ncbi:hypothetical protein [Solemya elarraichensis gill symbiont]|uniref:hypothetical protein n=1 Tax=Solemya elarraichensis gill symbiont TaxID=1918949 RepID=UPI001428B5AA|nr:hypothetical protein [Solemya elarraichensis gill symbiont]
MKEGKTGKKALILWSPELKRVIAKATKARKSEADTRLFQISSSGYDSAWRRAMDNLDERFQFKDLRAKHAADFEEQGGKLGHSSRGVTTRHYLRRERKITPIR